MTLDSVVRAQPELEPRHADVVRATLPLVAANIDRITAVFYRTMFDAHPQLLRDTFNRGNQAQGSQQRALAASIATFATYLVDPALPHPATMLSRIAHKHASLGVTPEQYQIVHDNLFAAIVEVLGADVVDETVASAWDRVYWLMADTLMDQEKGLYAEAGVDSGDVFRDVLVLAREDDPSGVAIFTVGSADPNTELPGFAPGQYVSVGVRLPDGARQLRQYSLVGRPGDGVLSFAVKRVDPAGGCPAGEVSSWLHEHLRPGDQLQVTLPFGDVVIDTAAQTPLVLISAGIARVSCVPSASRMPACTSSSSRPATRALPGEWHDSAMARLDYHALNSTIRYLMFSVFQVQPGVLGEDRDAATKEAKAFFDGLADRDVVVRGVYDVAGMRADADFMIWTHAERVEDLQAAYADFRRTTELGRASAPVWSNAALHRPAEFNKSHIPAFLAGEEPGAYICVYPFVRSYEWYLLPDEERRRMLAEHGKAARGYPDVRANTVSSFALGDYEWILAFEAPELHRIVDLMRDLRATDARRHVREEIPFFTGPRVEIEQLIAALP